MDSQGKEPRSSSQQPFVPEGPSKVGFVQAFLARAAITALALTVWFWSQSLIGKRTLTSGATIGDGLHDLLAPLNHFLHDQTALADGLLIFSSGLIDLMGVFLLAVWLLGRSTRPFLELVMVLGLRQIFQWLCQLPPPPDMIWHHPGFPSLLVTYGVSNDYFFSGHTAVAVLGAVELGRLGPRWLKAAGGAIVIFEIATVLILRAHYTMDVFTGLVTALYVATVAARLSPYFGRLLIGSPP